MIRAVAVTALAAVSLRGEAARACAGGDLVIEEVTTFDPKVLDETVGLYFNPFASGFGGGCPDCATQAMLADWRGYLGGAIAPAAWERLLLRAKPGEVIALARTTKDAKLSAALGFVDLAQRVEPLASLEVTEQITEARLADAKRRLEATRDGFLAQRYAFLVTRILFYRREWPALIAFVDEHAAALAAPSTDLMWRARYYLAGALSRSDRRARANYELARIAANAPALAGLAAKDFKPMEEADWRATLALATTPRETMELWRLAGVKSDGVVAIREIMRVDPTSNLLGLLVVRELARAESITKRSFESPGDPALAAAETRALATVESIATAIANTPGADRPWLMELVLGHLAAKRGDAVAARVHLQLAIAAQPKNTRVVSQAKASLALALAVDWRFNPHSADELARAMASIGRGFERATSMRSEVRTLLAKAYADTGQPVEAELLMPEEIDRFAQSFGVQRGNPRWRQTAFISELIARTNRTATEFDRFLLAGSHTRAHLEHELALRYLLDGDFTAAADTFRTKRTESGLLGTDPFVIHIRDCHDCDHAKYAGSKWTHASVAARLVELARTASGTGERAADASLALGNALYNVTWYGNARTMLANTHQVTRDTRAAERWYKRAFELTTNRELKAKAAYLAAKCELGELLNADLDNDEFNNVQRIPTTWFASLKTYADTKYAKEVLAECGAYRRWAAAN